MEVISGVDKKEVVQKLDRTLFSALEGYGITLCDKWIAIVDSIETCIRIADDEMPGTKDAKPNLERAVSLANRLLTDIKEVADDLRRRGKTYSDLECQTFAANTATEKLVLLKIFKAFGVGDRYENVSDLNSISQRMQKVALLIYKTV